MARLHYAWVVAGLTCLVLAVTAGMRAAPGVLLVELQRDFGWSSGSISVAFGINLLLYGLIGPFAVAVMDRWGIRRTLLGALGLIAGGAGLAVFIGAPWQLTVHRVPAQRTPPSHASTPTHRMSQVVAWVQSTMPVSHAVGPTQLTSHGRPGGHITPVRHWPSPQLI